MEQFNYLRCSFVGIDTGWVNLLRPLFTTNILLEIDDKLSKIAMQDIILPSAGQIFNAMRYTKFDDISVVIIGQDPYHGENQANGLCFSVNEGVRLPPSLKNIFMELGEEYNVDMKHADGQLLFSWAKQGVLLLNSSLTVIKDKPNSLCNIGWDIVTDHIIHKISELKQNVVFILWGAFAQKKVKLIDKNKHLVLMAAHPSPLSVYRGFFGCHHFIMANEYLKRHGKNIIDWLLTA